MLLKSHFKCTLRQTLQCCENGEQKKKKIRVLQKGNHVG